MKKKEEEIMAEEEITFIVKIWKMEGLGFKQAFI